MLILWCLFTEAEEILKIPDHYLDEDDEESVMKIRRFELPIREILVTGKTKMNIRMMKNYFKKFNSFEKVTAKGDDKRHFIITFNNVEGGSFLQFLLPSFATTKCELSQLLAYRVILIWCLERFFTIV